MIGDLSTLTEITSAMVTASREQRDAIEELRRQCHEYATAEREYRRAKARAFAEIAGDKYTVGVKEAIVNDRTADERYRRDLAEGLKQAALEAVRSIRGEISALQSMLAAHRAEAEFARTGPDWAA